MALAKRADMILIGLLVAMLALTLVPFATMLLLSVRSDADIYAQFWALPREWRWDFYVVAFRAVSPYLLNSVIVSSVSVVGVLVLSSLAGYVLARHRFPFRDSLFTLMVAMMMIPGILTLVPSFLLVKQLGLLNTCWALVLPYMAGGQLMGIFLCRSFIAEIPRDLIDAARIDGASELSVYWNVVVPLLAPVLATIAILNFFGFYNDFVWPLVVISDHSKQVYTVALMIFTAESDLEIGQGLAGYVLGCVPLTILILAGMKQFVAGTTAGALKV